MFVTGSSRGIGRAIAYKFAKNNYKIVLNCVKNKKEMINTLNEIKKFNKNVMALQGDVSDYDVCKDMFLQIEKKMGKVDILINNAGISYIGLFNEMKQKKWQEIIGTNIEGIFNTSHIALENMIKKKDGIIINISSIWGDIGASCEAVYSATKGAINSFTKALAKELAPSKIRINAVSCGVIDTDMNSFLSEDELKKIVEDIPYMRTGKASEVANLVFYLASDFSTYLTGQVIKLDGGYT